MKEEIVERSEADTGAQKVLDCGSLLEERVDRLADAQRRLEHVAEEREDRMEVLVLC